LLTDQGRHFYTGSGNFRAINAGDLPVATQTATGVMIGDNSSDAQYRIINGQLAWSQMWVAGSGYTGAAPSISSIADGTPLVKKNGTLQYVTISGTAVNADFSTQQVRAGLGTAALPSYTFSGAVNTGIWSPAPNTFAVSTGGSREDSC
jgi:hypothetical protein